ncbi:hypothetical protein [Niallia taxi]|uniref:hypothetical protein n=1 Tax=Niallia taxi TaxID=2499688 RepID=UPI0015F38B03|nr:hypothetical protein [Niallia taxi]
MTQQQLISVLKSAAEFPGCPDWLREEIQASLKSGLDHELRGTRDGIFYLPSMLDRGAIKEYINPFFVAHCLLLARKYSRAS